MSLGRLARRIATGAVVGRLVLAHFAAGLLKHVVPLAIIVRWAWREPQGPRDPMTERRYIARVIRVRRLVGSSGDCLQRSLLLYRGLSALGADPKLVVGFRPTPSGLQGHACVLVDGRLVAESGGDEQPFTPAFTFGRGGDLVSNAVAATTSRRAS
jgi:hypothetical protein